MGMGSAAVKFSLELWQRGVFKDIDSVIEIGAQKLYITLLDFEELAHMYGLTGYRKDDFETLKKYPGEAVCPSRAFYKILGIKDYLCIDMNKEGGAIQIDLNLPLEDIALYGKYDLVTDYGSNENVFNTSEAYRTMHKLCRPGGIILISQAAYRGGGYYAYDPSFLEGIAAANSYKILFSSYVITTAKSAESGSLNQFHLPLSRELIDAFDWTKMAELRIFYVMQKQSESDFCNPYQDVFLSMKQGNYGYEIRFSQDPPGRTYIPMHTLSGIDRKVLLREFFRRAYRKIRSYLCIR